MEGNSESKSRDGVSFGISFSVSFGASVVASVGATVGSSIGVSVCAPVGASFGNTCSFSKAKSSGLSGRGGIAAARRFRAWRGLGVYSAGGSSFSFLNSSSDPLSHSPLRLWPRSWWRRFEIWLKKLLKM